MIYTIGQCINGYRPSISIWQLVTQQLTKRSTFIDTFLLCTICKTKPPLTDLKASSWSFPHTSTMTIQHLILIIQCSPHLTSLIFWWTLKITPTTLVVCQSCSLAFGLPWPLVSLKNYPAPAPIDSSNYCSQCHCPSSRCWARIQWQWWSGCQSWAHQHPPNTCPIQWATRSSLILCYWHDVVDQLALLKPWPMKPLTGFSSDWMPSRFLRTTCAPRTVCQALQHRLTSHTASVKLLQWSTACNTTQRLGPQWMVHSHFVKEQAPIKFIVAIITQGKLCWTRWGDHNFRNTLKAEVTSSQLTYFNLLNTTRFP